MFSVCSWAPEVNTQNDSQQSVIHKPLAELNLGCKNYEYLWSTSRKYYLLMPSIYEQNFEAAIISTNLQQFWHI